MPIDWDNLPDRPTVVSDTCDRRGRDMVLYYNTGTCIAPVWVLHKGIIGDLTLSETEDDEELASRNPDRITKEYIDGEIDLAVTGTMGTDEGYAGYSFLMTRGSIGVMILTGSFDEENSSGWEGEWKNKDRTINGPTTGSMTTNFNLKPAACTLCPVRPVLTVEG